MHSTVTSQPSRAHRPDQSRRSAEKRRQHRRKVRCASFQGVSHSLLSSSGWLPLCARHHLFGGGDNDAPALACLLALRTRDRARVSAAGLQRGARAGGAHRLRGAVCVFDPSMGRELEPALLLRCVSSGPSAPSRAPRSARRRLRAMAFRSAAFSSFTA